MNYCVYILININGKSNPTYVGYTNDISNSSNYIIVQRSKVYEGQNMENNI